MAQNRLGRGLGALIHGGTPSWSTKTSVSSKPSLPAKPAPKVASKKAPLPTKAKIPVKPAPKPALPAKKPASTPAKAQKVISKPVVAAEVNNKAKEALVSTFVAPANDVHPHYREIVTDLIDPNPHQPRKEMDLGKIEELAESIRSEGLLQPIVVRPNEGRFELIAGERRLRACKLVGLKKIPARVVEVSNTSSAVIALIENLQREGLNPVEEALGYASLMKDFDLTQEAVAERVGKNRSTVANALRLLQLDKELQGYIVKQLLSMGHAKVLLGIEDPSQRTVLARRIIEEGLSVREAERAIRRLKAETGVKRLSRVSSTPDAAIEDLERQLTQRLNTRVFLKHTPKKGRLVIEYYGNDDLQRILEKTGLADEVF